MLHGDLTASFVYDRVWDKEKKLLAAEGESVRSGVVEVQAAPATQQNTKVASGE